MDERLILYEPAYLANERLAAYEILDATLGVQFRLQQLFGLRAEECQVLQVIILATVQRHRHQARKDGTLLDRTPLPSALRGGISRRGIAEATGVPFETVRRHVQRLIGLELVEEQRRGFLSTRGGTLARAADQGVPQAATQDMLAMANAMLRSGVWRVRPVRSPD